MGPVFVPQTVIGWVCLLQKGIKTWDEQAAVAYEHRWEFRWALIDALFLTSTPLQQVSPSLCHIPC